LPYNPSTHEQKPDKDLKAQAINYFQEMAEQERQANRIRRVP